MLPCVLLLYYVFTINRPFNRIHYMLCCLLKKRPHIQSANADAEIDALTQTSRHRVHQNQSNVIMAINQNYSSKSILMSSWSSTSHKYWGWRAFNRCLPFRIVCTEIMRALFNKPSGIKLHGTGKTCINTHIQSLLIYIHYRQYLAIAFNYTLW